MSLASVVRSSFISNTYTYGGKNICYHEFINAADEDTSDYINLEQNASMTIGGALCSLSSDIRIINSEFIYNTAEMGGVMFVYNSSIYVADSIYNFNRANISGVLATESTVTIDNSIFSSNVAELSGGVIVGYKQSFTIWGSTFSNNSIY